MYEYMLYWRRNDWVNQKTESNYYLSTCWRVLIVMMPFRPSYSCNRCTSLASAKLSSLMP